MIYLISRRHEEIASGADLSDQTSLHQEAWKEVPLSPARGPTGNNLNISYETSCPTLYCIDFHLDLVYMYILIADFCKT